MPTGDPKCMHGRPRAHLCPWCSGVNDAMLAEYTDRAIRLEDEVTRLREENGRLRRVVRAARMHLAADAMGTLHELREALRALDAEPVGDGLLHDRVHRDEGPVRAGKSVRQPGEPGGDAAPVVYEEPPMCPDCVTPWKCNGCEKHSMHFCRQCHGEPADPAGKEPKGDAP